jgi:glutathione S-transferase
MGKPMQLYEFAPTRSIRVRWMLQELGVDFESITVNLAAGEHCRPEFLKINPAGKVPVLVDNDNIADAERIFNALAENGTVRMPFEETFWAKRFAMLIDRFGTPWMINVSLTA